MTTLLLMQFLPLVFSAGSEIDDARHPGPPCPLDPRLLAGGTTGAAEFIHNMHLSVLR